MTLSSQDRKVFITIDSLVHLFREYLGKELVPMDTKAVAVKSNYDNIPGMLGVRMVSEGYTGTEPPEIVNFKVLRSF